ncbi:hypothetical protein BH10PSE11_BH10PSE11_04100 [soil metagenome]
MLDSESREFTEDHSSFEGGVANLSASPYSVYDADPRGSHVAVVDADLLFNADFKRSGDDLKLVGADGKFLLLPDYFKSGVHATLLSPEGAALTGDIVAALAGPRAAGQYASATIEPSAIPAIGHVVKLEGHATVVRNGVAITLNLGDAVLKGDVVQTGSGGTLGIVFNDGSAFQIASDSRLVLSDFAYKELGSADIEEFHLVQGSFSFASGAIAKHGNMRIGTPVATMKIDGTAGGGDVGSNNGEVTLYIFRQGDGEHKASILDQNGNTIATLTSEGGKLVLTPTGPSQFSSHEQGKTPADLAAELSALEAILKLKGITGGSGIIADAQPQTTKPHGSSSLIGDTSTPPVTPNDATPPAIVIPITIVIPPAPGNGSPASDSPAGPSAFSADVIDHKTYASDDSYVLNEDGILAVLPNGVLANDLTHDGSSITAIVDVGPQHGSLTFNSDGSFLYTPAAEFNGTDAFTYHATNGTTTSDPVTVTLTVTSVNDAPVIIVGTSPITVAEKTDVFVVPALTLADIDSTTLAKATVQITGNYHSAEDVLSFTDTAKIHGAFDIASGTLTLTAIAGQSPTLADFQTALRSVTYIDTSDAPSTSPRTITVTVQDPDGTAHFGQDSASGTVTLNVTAVNDAPVITSVTPPPDQTEALNASAQDIAPITGILTVLDADVGDTLTASIAGNAVIKLNGSTTLPPGVNLSALGLATNIYIGGATSDGHSKDLVWMYDPGPANLDFLNDTDVVTVTYTAKVNDGTVDSNTQTLTVTIRGVNDAAVITSATVNLNETDAIQTASGTLAITDVDSPAIFVAQSNAVGSGGYGHFTLGTGGVWSYAMDSAHNEFKAGVIYTDVLTVTSADGTTSSIIINIHGTDDIAVIAAATVNLSESNAILTTGGTIAIVDPDNSPTFVPQTNVAGTGGYGHFSLGADGVWTYATDNAHNEFVAGTAYTDTLNVAGTDGTTSTITVNIAGTNDAPELLGDLTASVSRSQAYTLTTDDLTASDPDDAISTFTVSDLQHGTIKLNGTATTTFTKADVAAGHVTFAQDGSANTTASFSVTVEDGNEDHSTPVASTFHFDVTLPPEPQTIAPSSVAAGTEDQTTGVAVVLSGTDPTGTVASYNITSLSHGQLYTDAGLSQLITGNVIATGNAANNFATTVYFKPAANFDGPASFQFAAVNNFGTDDTTPATAKIDIAPVVDAAAFSFGHGTVNLIVNGGFDTGMSGWSLGASNINYVFFDTTMGQYLKQAGPITNIYNLPGAVTGPYALAYPETTSYYAVLQQSFKIPYGLESLNISYDMFVLNRNGGHDNVNGAIASNQNAQFGRVDILTGGSGLFDTSSNAVLDNLFLGTTYDTDAVDPDYLNHRNYPASSWFHYDLTSGTSDLISFTSDQTYAIRFAAVNGYPIPLDMGVDNVVVQARIGSVGFQNDGEIVIGKLSTGDTDGSEHVTKLVLSGFVAGTVFKLNGVQVGALDTTSGKWVITDQAALDALATTNLTATLPADYVGSFNVTSEATVTDSAIYSDGSVHTASQTFTDTLKVEILTPNHAPLSSDARATVTEDAAYTLRVSDFAFSDTDNDGIAAVKIIDLPGAGTLKLNGVAVTAGQTIAITDIGSGQLIYTPPLNAAGTGVSSFTFQVQDDGGSGGHDATHVGSDLSLTHTVTLDVNPVADIPAFLPPAAGARVGDEDTTINLGTLDISTSDPSETIKVTISGFPAGAVFKIDGLQVGALDSTPGSPTFGQWIITSASDIASLHDHALQLAPPANLNGNYSLSIAATTTDSAVVNGATVTSTSAPVTQTVSVTITPVNDAPVANDDFGTTTEDHAVIFAGSTLRANDSDIETAQASLVVSAVSNATGGTVILNGGNPLFTPTANFSGIAGFDYTISDGSGGFKTAHVKVDVAPIADAPNFGFASNISGFEETNFAVGKIAVSDTDGSESITKIVLSGFPDGAVFLLNNQQVGSLVGSTWVIDNATDIASLAATDLYMKPPHNYFGNFSLTTVTTVLDSAILSTGAVSQTNTYSNTVSIDLANTPDPVVFNQAIPSQQAAQNAPFSFQIDSQTFADPDHETLAYTATLENSDPLPLWLTFDPLTQTFAGTPPDTGTVRVKVIASDGTSTASAVFQIDIRINSAPVAAPVEFSVNVGLDSLVTLVGSDPDAGDAVRYKFTDIPSGISVFADEAHTVQIAANQIFSNATVYITSDDIGFLGHLTYVALDPFSAQSAPAFVTAVPPAPGVFTGTSGDDVANAVTRTITGFTGGTDSQLRDLIGDTFIPGDGTDVIVAGNGDDTFQFTSATNFSAGDSFNGGGGNNSIDITNIANADIRSISFSNIQNIVGGSDPNLLSLTLAQFSSLAAIDLGGGVDRVNVYLPASYGAVGTPTNYDITGLGFPGLYNVELVYLMGDSYNQSITLSNSDAQRFGGIDLGGGNDTLIINPDTPFTYYVPLLHNITNVENVIYTGSNNLGAQYYSDGHAGHATLMSSARDDLYWGQDGSQQGSTAMPHINAVSSGDNIILTYNGDVITIAHDGSFERVLLPWNQNHVLTVTPGLESPGTGSYLIVGTDAGETLTTHGSFNMVFGGGGNDTLTGDGQNDTFFGGTGNDLLKSLSVSSTNYVFSFGDGSDIIDDAGSGPNNIGGKDRVIIDAQGAALTTFSVDHILNTNDLKITYNGGDITFLNALNASNTNAINFNNGTYKGYNLGYFDYVIADPAHAGSVQNGNNGVMIVGTNGVSNVMDGAYYNKDIYIGGDQADTLIIYGGGDLVFGGGGADSFLFHDQGASSLTTQTVIADFTDGVDALDFAVLNQNSNGYYQNGLTRSVNFSDISQSIDADGNTIVKVNVPDPANTQMSIKLLGAHTLTADDFIFQYIPATFTGTSGNDTADASARTLVGFTGGNANQLSDTLGDTYLPGDGDDIIHAGLGADTVKLTSASNLSAGDVFDGGGLNRFSNYDTLDIQGIYNIDFRIATIQSFEYLYNFDDGDNFVQMSMDQFLQFNGIYLGFGYNQLDVYLPSSINSIDLATAPTTVYDATGSLSPFSVSSTTAILQPTGSGNQSIKLTSDEVKVFTTIDLGDGDQDALTVVSSANFTLDDSKFVNIEKMTIIDGTGSDTLTGSNRNDWIYGNDGDDIIRGNGGDDYLDGGTGQNQFLIGANDGHDTIAYVAGGTRQVVVDGTYVSGGTAAGRSISLNITHTGTHDLQITYGDTIVDLQNYTEGDSLDVAGWSPTGGYPFLYHTYSQTFSGLHFHDGLVGTDNRQILVGTNSGDSITGAGYGNLMFGGDGNDIITGGTLLTGSDYTGTGSGDIFVGGKGDDMLISLGLRDPNFNGGASNTYVFNAGDGHDTIDDRGGGDSTSNLYADRIVIDTKGAALTAFSAVHDPSAPTGAHDLVINYGTGDSITVLNQFDGNDHNIEFINFNGASYAGYDFGTIDYTISKDSSTPFNGIGPGRVVVGDLNTHNDLNTYNSSNMILVGGNADDTLSFLNGAGLMIGGGGADTFVFNRISAVAAPAVIADFQDGIDKIDMRIPFASTPLVFGSTLTVTETADATLVHADVFGGGIDFKLHGLHALTANDFILT